MEFALFLPFLNMIECNNCTGGFTGFVASRAQIFYTLGGEITAKINCLEKFS